jgi:transcriptional regulator with XRE-family HTH domain
MLRKSRRWTQEGLAEHSGLSRTYIGGIERGERNLAILNVNRLALALGDDLSGFFPCTGRSRGRTRPSG